jgi:hypothetical protein
LAVSAGRAFFEIEAKDMAKDDRYHRLTRIHLLVLDSRVKTLSIYIKRTIGTEEKEEKGN